LRFDRLLEITLKYCNTQQAALSFCEALSIDYLAFS
jgi:hypothetical protein